MRDRLRSTTDTTMAPRMSTRLLFSVEEYKRPVAATRRESDGDKNLIRGWRSAFRGIVWPLEQAVGLGESDRKQDLLTICASFNKLSPVVKPKVLARSLNKIEDDRENERHPRRRKLLLFSGIFHTRYAYMMSRKTWRDFEYFSPNSRIISPSQRDLIAELVGIRNWGFLTN